MFSAFVLFSVIQCESVCCLCGELGCVLMHDEREAQNSCINLMSTQSSSHTLGALFVDYFPHWHSCSFAFDLLLFVCGNVIHAVVS